MADPYLTPEARGRIHVDQAEREMRTAVNAAFRQYLDHAAAAVLDHQTSGDLAAAAHEPDPDLWPPRTVWDRLVAAVALPVVARIWRRAFHRFLSRDQRAQLKDTDYLQAHLDDTTERLTGAAWPDEVYDAVRQQIAEGTRLGESLRQLRARVRTALGPDRWTGRAHTIARTEAMSALAGGSYRAGRARHDVFGETLVKRWISAEDHRVRPAHALADGQTVPMDEPFTVGGEALQHPHDPRGSAENNVNCRCVLVWDTAQEENPMDLTAASRMPGDLKRYWTHGAGAAKIRWGTGGDFDRCRRHLRKYVSNHMIDGLCANLHKRALGVWPGQEGTKADAGGCPCEDMTNEQIEEALASMHDDPETAAELTDTEPEPDDTAEQRTAETPDDGPAWSVPPDTGRGGKAATAAASPAWVERVAESVPFEPDPAAFQQEPGERGTKMHVVNDQGWVAGYLADWGAVHRGQDIPPPRDPYGGSYPKFHRHRVRTSDGETVMTGPVATNGHGTDGMDPADLAAVMAHYDDPNYVAANVRVVETEHGIWASGSLRPGVSPFQVAMLNTYSQSGHWMPGPSGFAADDGELVASCCVSVEGFELEPHLRREYDLAAAAGPPQPILSEVAQVAAADEDGRCVALTAAGVVTRAAARPAPPLDGWTLYRQFQVAAAADRRVIAARRRVHAPRLAAAAERVRQVIG